MNKHTIEKIGGTSMSNYAAVRDSIVFGQRNGDTPYQRAFVVSAYGGMTDKLLEHKKDGKPGVYGLFASSFKDRNWEEALEGVRADMYAVNASLRSGRPAGCEPLHRRAPGQCRQVPE